uniref:AGPT-Pplase2 domain-containing protein n=1 Tax=Steinernema glaseri TaxID=37863 RepID=A0A1I8ABS9_9BILA
MPHAQHMIETCNKMWHSSKNYEEYTAYLLCVKFALGEQRIWPGKLRIHKRAHSWVRDAWLTSNDWTDLDFMFHGWKIEDLETAKDFVSPFTKDFNVSECGRGYSGWHYRSDKKKPREEIKRQLANFEKQQMDSHPKEGRIPYFLAVPDIGECYPYCEDI